MIYVKECYAINLRTGQVLIDVSKSSKPSPKKRDHMVVNIDDEEVDEEIVEEEESKKKKQA